VTNAQQTFGVVSSLARLFYLHAKLSSCSPPLREARLTNIIETGRVNSIQCLDFVITFDASLSSPEARNRSWRNLDLPLQQCRVPHQPFSLQSDSQQHSLLFNLPLELRYRIYAAIFQPRAYHYEAGRGIVEVRHHSRSATVVEHAHGVS
jgi:hypothetical protein